MASIADVEAAAPSFALASKDPFPWGEIDYQRQTGNGECAFWVELNEWSAAMDVIDGVNQLVTISTSPLIQVTRSVPLQHPFEPLLYMNRVRWTIRPASEVKHPDIPRTGTLVKLDVGFYLPPYGLSGEPYQRITIRGTETPEAADGAAFDAGDGGGAPSFEVPLYLPGMSYSATVFDAPAMDETHENYLRSMAGRVNNDVWRGNAPGTVRYHSPNIDYSRKRDGSRTATYSLQFDAKPRDWNYELARDGSLRRLLVGGANRFLPLDFRTLFI